jgi:putative two-component system hydrogenase maturation factor HypX/HoxX
LSRAQDFSTADVWLWFRLRSRERNGQANFAGDRACAGSGDIYAAIPARLDAADSRLMTRSVGKTQGEVKVKILLLVSGFNGLTQRMHRELVILGHTVSVELALNRQLMLEAVELFGPDVIICPFLKERIPDEIWKKHVCLVVHPGIEGDRGPSSLDWAVSTGMTGWGVTLLQAAREMDAGHIWGTKEFSLREAGKASLYRREVAMQAVQLVRQALVDIRNPKFKPRPLDYSRAGVHGTLRPAMQQSDRHIDWQRDTSDTVIRKINAADSSPGVLDEMFDEPVYYYGARREPQRKGKPGTLIARCGGAICKATADGAVWIRMAKRKYGPDKARIKLAAAEVLDTLAREKNRSVRLPAVKAEVCEEIRSHESNGVGYLYFDFYNGAMNTEQCRQLRQALQKLKQRPVKVIALMGGEDFWGNGIHLNCIEAAADPAAESWRNIQAMDDLVEEIILSPKQITVAALRNNAGAGGAIMPLACDRVAARDGVVLNPHYATMGLYGSEYWTYLLPRRTGEVRARQIMGECMPMLAREALLLEMVDELFDEDWERYHEAFTAYAEKLAQPQLYCEYIAGKQRQRKADEKSKPLLQYREEELEQMHANFFGAHGQYHRARYDFVHKERATKTPPRLALHRKDYPVDAAVEAVPETLFPLGRVISG